MTNTELTQETINHIENHKDHFETYTGEIAGPDGEVYDDGFVHITRRGVRFAFDRGDHFTGKNMFSEKDVPRFSRFVDEVIARRQGEKQ